MTDGRVTLRVLGSGDAFASGGRFFTCFDVRHPGGRFLIDCGASALIAMKRWGVPPNEIDAILVTHFHGDHFGGIPFFLIDTQLVSRRTEPLTIAGPPGVEGRVKAAMEVLFPGASQVTPLYDLRFVEWVAEEPVPVDACVVTAFQVLHAPASLPHALRIEIAGKVIAYSGDTEWTDVLLRTAEGADLFICEAYTFDRTVPLHTDYVTLLGKRDELSCDRLVCTHMSDEMLARAGSLELECAEDGLELTV